MGVISLLDHSNLLTRKIVDKFEDKVDVKQGFAGFFPRETTPSLRVGLQVKRNNRLMAVDVMRFANAQSVKRTKHTEKLFVPPYYRLETIFSASDIYNETFGVGVEPTKSQARAMMQEVLDATSEHKDMIERAIQKQQAEVLQTGVVTLKNGDSIDFKRKAASMPNITNKWNTAAGNPIKDMQDGAEFLRDEGNSNGSIVNVVMRREVFQAMLANDNFKSTSNLEQNINRSNIDFPQMDGVSGMTLQGKVALGDFIGYIWTYNQGYQVDADSGITKYLDGDKFIMLAEDFKGATVFGAVPAEGAGGMPVAKEGEYYFRSYTDKKTISKIFDTSSAPIVIPVTVDRVYTGKVL